VSDSGVRIPVLAGDRLGVALGGNAKFVHEAGGSPGQLGAFAGDPGPGSDFSTSAAGAYNLLVSARLEPDVDGDGYGDESQDACPTVSTGHLIPCLTPPPPPPPPPGGSTGSDLAAGLSVRPARVRPGQTVVVTATATSRSGASSAAHVRLALPAALKLVSALGSSGRCVGLVCPVGALPPVAAGRALYTVKASRAGRYTLKARASHANQDLAPGNDAASAKLSVVAPVRCVVPKQTGLTLAKAKRRLAKAHCRLGKVTGPRTGRITVQTGARRPSASGGRRSECGSSYAARAPESAGTADHGASLARNG
jgi:hypothetical protein